MMEDGAGGSSCHFHPTGIMLRSQVGADDAFGFVPPTVHPSVQMEVKAEPRSSARVNAGVFSRAIRDTRSPVGREQIILRRPRVDSSTFTLLSLEYKSHTHLQGSGWKNRVSVWEESSHAAVSSL